MEQCLPALGLHFLSWKNELIELVSLKDLILKDIMSLESLETMSFFREPGLFDSGIKILRSPWKVMKIKGSKVPDEKGKDI